jgi:LacI family transcriptional regulator
MTSGPPDIQPRRGPATIRDVAELARVHPSTVSRAMNTATRSRVKADTVTRVLDAAGKLGYRANATARALRLQRSQSVGVIVPDLTNPIIPPIVQGIESRVGDAGYVVLLGNTAHSDERERLYIDAMTSNQVGGIISAAAHENDDALAEAMAMGIAVVLVNRAVDDGSIAAAVPDDRLCSELAVAHLARLGHQKIAHVAGPPTTTTGFLRRAGFEEALVRRGLPLDPASVAVCERYTIEEGERACRELLQRHRDFSAIVAGNDMIALGCYDALAEAGLRCPSDISIVGCNDMPFTDRFNPPLTTVDVSPTQLGIAAAELLLDLLEEPDRVPRQVFIAPRLVVRASTAGPSGR